MAKKVICITIVLFALSVSPSFAQEASTSAGSQPGSPSTVREELLQRREEARAEVSEAGTELRAQINAQRQAFQQRAAQIADTQQQQVIMRLDTQLQLTNEQVTDAFLNTLNQLDRVMDKIEVRRDSAQSQGRDVTRLTQALTNAGLAMTDARTLVEEQSQSAYIINITTDAALRSSAQDAIGVFRTDVQQLRSGVMEAKNSVVASAGIAVSLSQN